MSTLRNSSQENLVSIMRKRKGEANPNNIILQQECTLASVKRQIFDDCFLLPLQHQTQWSRSLRIDA